jgi:hypothetical protein
MTDWTIEQERFEKLAYQRAMNAARRAFKSWHERKRDDAVAEMVGKVWATWRFNVEKGKDPVALLSANIHWAILFVRYDRRIAGRARGFDVFDYRAKMTRQDLDSQGRPHPTERGVRENYWIDWHGVAIYDDPAAWAEAKDGLGL